MLVRTLRNVFFYLSLMGCATDANQNSQERSSPSSDQSPAAHGLTEQLKWVLSVFNERQGKLTRDEITSHFHATFLTAVPADQVPGIFLQLFSQYGQLTLQSTDPVVSPAPGVKTLVAHVTANADKLRIVLSIDEASAQINGLFFQPDIPAKVPVSLKEADQMLKAQAPRTNLLIAEVKKDVCSPVHQLLAPSPLGIGSAFKLYVLLALVERIREGKLAWTDTIAIRDEWKSLPTGTMQNEPAGKTFTVQKFAEQMIAISDNTATDHLLHTIGRERVEAALRQTGHHKPGLNIPFLSTKELFLLKLKAGEAEAYLRKNPAEKRKYLDSVLTPMPLTISATEAAQWTKPRFIESLEWFAKGDDICQVMATFLKKWEQDSALMKPVMEILSKNPVYADEGQKFAFIGFKGGSEPGVMSLNWLLQRKDLRWFVVSLTANDKDNPLKEAELVGIATGVLNQVAAIP